jgi:RNA polymerase sigma-70 factor (ECF subfamily)
MPSDEALYERLLGGDMGAFDALYGRYEAPLYGFIRTFVADAAEAEEIFHEAFVTVLREGRRKTGVSRFKPWLYRVARNLCLNRLRGKRRGDRALEALAADPSPEVEGPRAWLERAETAEALRRAVSRLPEKLGEVYALRAAGMSYEHLAEVLGIPIGTVKSRVNRMLERLREEMSV